IIGGNIREWRQGNDVSPTINSVNDSNSQEVFRGLPNTFLGGPAVIDMLSVNLPQNFQGKTLKKITLTDIIILPHPTTGPGSAPGFIWMGLTVQGSVVSPTPTPTPTPVPIPFLDLPWDYQGKTFENAGLDPVSWFDHEYPLQNVSCCEEQVKNYTGNTISKPYRSHNGYDYGLKNGVELNTPVLAAASGTATFSDDCGACGNMILIDHGNGYQTRYLHLQKDGLIVSEEGEDHKVSVEKGQQIGKTGMTGKATGPHIHFSVFQDTDGDESFDDENPYGVTDPLGWEGSLPDPWSEYKFEGNPDDETDDKTGTASFNLFIKRAAPQTVAVDQNGGTFTFGNLEVTVPADTVVALSKLSNNWGPFESIKDSIKSIIPSFFLELKDSSGQKITQFSKPVQISYDYSSADLKNIDEDSLQLYSFNDQTNQWDPIATILDKINKIARG
ncbi:M23 family metallopeptidase, partial [Candidatus Curtissbacteria bacterium]|nr:M23 family metallopeptidase [Candidatus Curtissbacteria bacterium]